MKKEKWLPREFWREMYWRLQAARVRQLLGLTKMKTLEKRKMNKKKIIKDIDIIISIENNGISNLIIKKLDSNELTFGDNPINRLCNDIKYAYNKGGVLKFGIQFEDNKIYQIEIVPNDEAEFIFD